MLRDFYTLISNFSLFFCISRYPYLCYSLPPSFFLPPIISIQLLLLFGTYRVYRLTHFCVKLFLFLFYTSLYLIERCYAILKCTAVGYSCVHNFGGAVANTRFEDENIRDSTLPPCFLIPLLTVACRTTTDRRYDTQERATKICLVGPLGVSAAQGLLPVGMATSHCSVGVAVDAVLMMVAEVTVSRPDALRFFGYRDYNSRGDFTKPCSFHFGLLAIFRGLSPSRFRLGLFSSVEILIV